MNKFNVGDKVVRVGSDCLLAKVGGTYTVGGFYQDGSIYLEEIHGEFDPDYFELIEEYTKHKEEPPEYIPPEVVVLGDELVPTLTDWTDKHYNAIYKLTEKDIERGWIKIDPYRVSKQWRLGSKDESGALFHVLKTLARMGEKNSVEREVKALLAQIKCFAEIEGIDYE